MTNIEEWVKDRMEIEESFDNKADKAFLNGIIETLYRMGYDLIKKGDEVKIIKR